MDNKNDALFKKFTTGTIRNINNVDPVEENENKEEPSAFDDLMAETKRIKQLEDKCNEYEEKYKNLVKIIQDGKNRSIRITQETKSKRIQVLIRPSLCDALDNIVKTRGLESRNELINALLEDGIYNTLGGTEIE